MPVSIISGFKYTGVYPFNPQIVLDKCTTADQHDASAVTVTDDSKPSDSENENASSGEEENGMGYFTAEEEKRFQRQYKEGYNLYNPKYNSWLKI